VKDVIAIVLGGGRGTGLYPLTLQRAKPALAFGGKYRIIDIPLSNCIHSDIKRVFVLTQFLSALDKNVRIGDGVTIRARPEVSDLRTDTHWVQDGITVVPKGTVIPAGTTL
jgi:ADP-glucose pyrophosphorylase